MITGKEKTPRFTLFKSRVKENEAHKIKIPGKKEVENITTIPPIPDKDTSEVEVNAIEKPFSYVRILYNSHYNEYTYEIIEPQLNPDEETMITKLKEHLIALVEFKDYEIDAERIQYMYDLIDHAIKDLDLRPSAIAFEKIKYYIIRDFIGFGMIQVPMHDPNVEDISCDGLNIPIYIYHRRYGSIRSNMKFDHESELNNFVIWIVQKSGKNISVATPMIDATLPDGSRLQTTLGKHVTQRGSSFTIRRFKPNPFTPLDLITFRTLSKEMMVYVWLAVENGMSMMVVGGTASGKTTTLNAILLFIPPQQKIISIEDTRELNLPQENWIPSLVREGFGEFNVVSGKRAGEIDMFDLLAAALRQRPQYIMVGEVRGAEAYTVFQAMATGKTCYSTFHAEDVKKMVHRLENDPINLPRPLLTSLDIVLLQAQVKVGTKMTRRVKSITEIVTIDPETEELVTNNAYTWNPADDVFSFSGHSYVYEKIGTIRNWNPRRMEIEVKRREQILTYMDKIGARNYTDVARIVSAYYKNPEGLMDRVKSVVAE